MPLFNFLVFTFQCGFLTFFLLATGPASRFSYFPCRLTFAHILLKYFVSCDMVIILSSKYKPNLNFYTLRNISNVNPGPSVPLHLVLMMSVWPVFRILRHPQFFCSCAVMEKTEKRNRLTEAKQLLHNVIQGRHVVTGFRFLSFSKMAHGETIS